MPNETNHEFLKEALYHAFGTKAAILIVGDVADVLKVGVPTSLDVSIHFDPTGRPAKIEVGTHRTVPWNGNGKKNWR